MCVDRKETSFTGFDPLNSQLNTFYNSRLAVGKILPPVIEREDSANCSKLINSCGHAVNVGVEI